VILPSLVFLQHWLPDWKYTHDGIDDSLGVDGHQVDHLAGGRVLLPRRGNGQRLPVNCRGEGRLHPDTDQIHDVEVSGEDQGLEGAGKKRK